MPENTNIFNKKIVMWVGSAFILLLIAGVIWAFSQNRTTELTPNNNTNTEDQTSSEQDTMDNYQMPESNDTIVPSPQVPAPQAQSETEAIVEKIGIANFAFSPIELRIKQGTTVVWTNNDSAEHTVTSSIGTELNSSLFGKEQTYSHTFNTKGEFGYYCKPHPWMTGKVIVE